ncbi:50S ribosomal protein L9 [bacterium]|nr:50S ribosomal protein L9 [bacterium]
MKVLLLKEVPGLGKQGDIKDVSDGYARNYLIPRGLAEELTEGTMKSLQQRLEQLKKKEERLKKEVEAAIEKLKNERLVVPVAVGKDGKLFGSIGNKDIAQLLAERGIKVDKRDIEMDSPLKHIGVFQIPIRMPTGQRVEITVELVPKE